MQRTVQVSMAARTRTGQKKKYRRTSLRPLFITVPLYFNIVYRNSRAFKKSNVRRELIRIHLLAPSPSPLAHLRHFILFSAAVAVVVLVESSPAKNA